MKKSIVTLIAAGFLVVPWLAEAASVLPKFSVDPASPAIDGNLTPDDVLVPGPTVSIQGSSLGLEGDFFNGEFDNLNALSFGKDPIKAPILFSVDRVAVGLPGSAVYEEAKPGVESAAGDVYKALPPSGSNTLAINETALGLTGGFFGDDLDALELDTEPTPYIYFSVDFLSPSGDFTDILISIGDGTFEKFADGENEIGLQEGDDLDALILWDIFEPGVLNPGIDLALFSLSTFSPSTFTSGLGTYSPADILFTDFTNKFSVWVSATDIGLRPDDELDALDAVPEPGTWLLLSLGMAGFWVWTKKTQKPNA